MAFDWEGTHVQVQKKKQQTAFQMASLPDSSDDSVLTALSPPTKDCKQTKANEKCQHSPALCIQSNNHLLTPPPPSNISKEKWVQWRIQPAPKSLTAPMFGGAHLHFSKLLTERSYLHLSPAQFQ